MARLCRIVWQSHNNIVNTSFIPQIIKENKNIVFRAFFNYDIKNRLFADYCMLCGLMSIHWWHATMQLNEECPDIGHLQNKCSIIIMVIQIIASDQQSYILGLVQKQRDKKNNNKVIVTERLRNMSTHTHTLI